MLNIINIIICANFGVEKIKGLGNTRGQIFDFPIEMAGHPYNCYSAALPRSLWYTTHIGPKPLSYNPNSTIVFFVYRYSMVPFLQLDDGWVSRAYL